MCGYPSFYILGGTVAFASTADLTFQEEDSSGFYVDVELTLAGGGILECDVEVFLQIVNSIKAGMLLSQVITLQCRQQYLHLFPLPV